MREEVLVVPTSVLFAPPRSAFEGFQPGSGSEYLDVVSKNGSFLRREDAEEDCRYKQLIPYGMVVCREQVFVMRRSSKGGDRRLHRKLSLGVGGHVNPADDEGGALAAAVERAFEREVREELDIESPRRIEVVGVINDDSNAVGRVHFGVVYRLEVEEARVRVKEEDVLEGGFTTASELDGLRESMETWSRILLDHFWSRG